MANRLKQEKLYGAYVEKRFQREMIRFAENTLRDRRPSVANMMKL